MTNMSYATHLLGGWTTRKNSGGEMPRSNKPLVAEPQSIDRRKTSGIYTLVAEPPGTNRRASGH